MLSIPTCSRGNRSLRPCPNDRVSPAQKLYDFRDTHGIRLVEAGRGIAHQVFDERLHRSGNVDYRRDSHPTMGI